MVLKVETDSFGQFAHGEAPAEHGQALENHDDLLTEDGEWAVASGDDKEGIGDGHDPQEPINRLPAADHEAAQSPGLHRLEGGLNRPSPRIHADHALHVSQRRNGQGRGQRQRVGGPVEWQQLHELQCGFGVVGLTTGAAEADGGGEQAGVPA